MYVFAFGVPTEDIAPQVHIGIERRRRVSGHIVHEATNLPTTTTISRNHVVIKKFEIDNLH
jgi:hypothetical protein